MHRLDLDRRRPLLVEPEPELERHRFFARPERVLFGHVSQIRAELGRGAAARRRPYPGIAAQGDVDRVFRGREDRFQAPAVRRAAGCPLLVEDVQRAVDEDPHGARLGFHGALVGELEAQHVPLEELMRALPPALELGCRPSPQAALGHEPEERLGARLAEGAIERAAVPAARVLLAREEERPVALDRLQPGHRVGPAAEPPRGRLDWGRTIDRRGVCEAARRLVLERRKERGGVVVLERAAEEQLFPGLALPLRE